MLLIYSAFFHPRMYWFPQNLPWLKLGETVFTLDLNIKRINSLVINLGNELFPKFSEIRKKRLRLTKKYLEALTQIEKALEFMPSNSHDEIALLRFPIIFILNTLAVEEAAAAEVALSQQLPLGYLILQLFQ